MRKFFKWLGVGMLIVAVVACVFLFGAYRATQQEPEFYQQALVMEPEIQVEASRELETKVTELTEEVRREGEWQAEFTEQQVNAWLAEELPKKQHVLPVGASDPRVHIEEDELKIACRYADSRITTVLLLQVGVELTDNPNELAVRIVGVSAGSLPFPLSPFKDDVTKAVRKADVPIEWKEDEADVALVQLPLEDARLQGKRLIVEELELRKGSIHLAGVTEKPAESNNLEGDLLRTAELRRGSTD